MVIYSNKYKENLENELDILNKSGRLSLTHERENGGSGLSIPIGRDGTYVGLIEVQNGIVHHPKLTFVDKESYCKIDEVVNEYDSYVQTHMQNYVKNFEGKIIGIRDLGVLYDVTKVYIKELEGFIPDNQFVGMVDYVKPKYTTLRLGSFNVSGNVKGKKLSKNELVELGLKTMKAINEESNTPTKVTRIKFIIDDEESEWIVNYSPYAKEEYMSDSLLTALKYGMTLNEDQKLELDKFKVDRIIDINNTQ